VPGECAATRAHFDDSILVTRPNGVGNALEDGVVSEEVLPEAFANRR
jgi:hypothetical protein